MPHVGLVKMTGIVLISGLCTLKHGYVDSSSTLFGDDPLLLRYCLFEKSKRKRLMDAHLDQNDFEINEKGNLTPYQIRQLSLWCVRYGLVFFSVGLAFFLAAKEPIEYIIGGMATLTVFVTIWRYGLDLLKPKMELYSGSIHKEVRRFRGPSRYDFVMSNGARVRAFNKAQWLELEDNHDYVLFCTKRTKWLLSWKNQYPEKDAMVDSKAKVGTIEDKTQNGDNQNQGTDHGMTES